MSTWLLNMSAHAVGLLLAAPFLFVLWRRFERIQAERQRKREHNVLHLTSRVRPK